MHSNHGCISSHSENAAKCLCNLTFGFNFLHDKEVNIFQWWRKHYSANLLLTVLYYYVTMA